MGRAHAHCYRRIVGPGFCGQSVILAERLNLLTGDDKYDALMRSQIGELDTRLGKLKQLINDNSLERATRRSFSKPDR